MLNFLTNRRLCQYKNNARVERYLQIDSIDNLLFQNDEPSIYLIEEDFWEEDAVITTYFSKIAKSEFETVNPNKETWPIISNAEEFNAYFRYFSGNMVFDLLSIGINSEEV